jgi:hypothetical protein
LHYRVKIEWNREDGSIATAELGQIECGPCQSAADVGLKLADAKPLLARLQQVVVSEQVRHYCEAARLCPSCQARRNIKDYRTRQLDTVMGRIAVDAPRLDGCRFCGDDHVTSPLSRLLPRRVTPELHHLQAKLSAELPYGRAAALLQELLPEMGGLTAMTTRNRTLAVGKEIERELCEEVDHPRASSEPVQHLTVGIDGAFVKARRSAVGERRQFEILTGRIERQRGRGEAFAIVRDLDKRAKQKVQAVLRQCGRGPKTGITVLSDGEDGLRGVVGWFGGKCHHRLDWFHVSRRLERIRKDLLYLPASDDFSGRLAFHSKNLDRVKWTLWNHGIEMADWGMKIFRAGLAEHAWDEPKESLSRFQAVESRLDELRFYLYSNQNSVRGYVQAFRRQERVSTAHVESTVNQLINWRFCKKQQMSWTRSGAQGLLHVKTAVLNGRLDAYTGFRDRLAAAA